MTTQKVTADVGDNQNIILVAKIARMIVTTGEILTEKQWADEIKEILNEYSPDECSTCGE